MEKNGMLAAQRSRCDICGEKSVAVIGNVARCPEHLKTKSVKEASVEPVISLNSDQFAQYKERLKSFTTPMPGHAEG